jgi:hypothetical protein
MDERLRKCGADFFEVSSDENIVDPIAAYLRGQNAGRRRVR